MHITRKETLIIDWGHLNEKDRKTKISNTLEYLGNVKKQKMSSIFSSEMLGMDGLVTLKIVSKKREETLSKELRNVNMIHLAVRYFEEQMKKRRAVLFENMEKSQSKTYSRRVYSWKATYDSITRSKCYQS